MFHYGFGARWRFTVKLEQIEASETIEQPAVVASHDEAPPEYEYDEEW